MGDLTLTRVPRVVEHHQLVGPAPFESVGLESGLQQFRGDLPLAIEAGVHNHGLVPGELGLRRVGRPARGDQKDLWREVDEKFSAKDVCVRSKYQIFKSYLR